MIEKVTEIRISASSDDVEEAESGSLYFNSTDLELVDDGSWRPNQTVGLRYNGLDIPQGAVITAAHVQFQVDETDSGTSMLLIRGEDTDNAAAFTDTAYNVSSRQLTEAAVEWSPSEWTSRGEAGAEQQTADISPIIQEIVNRDGWAALNSLALVISGDGERTAESYDGDKSAAPLLHVEWSLPDDHTS